MSDQTLDEVVIEKGGFNLPISVNKYNFFYQASQKKENRKRTYNTAWDAKSVYEHLIFTGILQATNNVWATKYYLLNGLGISEERLVASLNFLKQAKLLEEIQTHAENGTFGKRYLKVITTEPLSMRHYNDPTIPPFKAVDGFDREPAQPGTGSTTPKCLREKEKGLREEKELSKDKEESWDSSEIEKDNHPEKKEKSKIDKSIIDNNNKESFNLGAPRTSNIILKEDYTEIVELFQWAGIAHKLDKDSKSTQLWLKYLRQIENGSFIEKNDFKLEWVDRNGILKAFTMLRGKKFTKQELETLLRKPLAAFKKMRAGGEYFKINGADSIKASSFLFESFKNKTSYFLLYLVNKPALNRNYVSDIQAERAKASLTVEKLKMNWDWILGQLRGCNYSVGKWSEEEEQKALFSALHLFKWYRENHPEKPNLVKRFFEDIFTWLKTQNDVKPEFMSPSSPAWQWFNRFCKENLDGDWIVEKRVEKKKPEPQKAGVTVPSSLDEEELAQEIAEERGLTFVEALPIAKKQLQAEYQKKLKIS